MQTINGDKRDTKEDEEIKALIKQEARARDEKEKRIAELEKLEKLRKEEEAQNNYVTNEIRKACECKPFKSFIIRSEFDDEMDM